MEAPGLLLVVDASLSPASLEQARPLLARGGVVLHQGTETPAGPPRRVLLFDGHLSSAHAEWVDRDVPVSLLATRGSERQPSAWEVRLLGTLPRGGSLLPDDVAVTRHRLQRVVEIGVAATVAAVAVGEAGGSRAAAGLVADVVHEIAANALLDAPVDSDGTPRYAHRRTDVQEVAPEDACELSHGVSQGRMWLEVVDRFGRLGPRPFARALAGWGARVKVDASGGGAGLGLRRILEHCDAVAVRVVAGRESRMLCVVDLGESRRRASHPKSLLFSLE